LTKFRLSSFFSGPSVTLRSVPFLFEEKKPCLRLAIDTPDVLAMDAVLALNARTLRLPVGTVVQSAGAVVQSANGIGFRRWSSYRREDGLRLDGKLNFCDSRAKKLYGKERRQARGGREHKEVR